MIISAPPDSTKAFVLECGVCGWESLVDSGLGFDRPTGLASQLTKDESNRADLVEFKKRKDWLTAIISKESKAKLMNQEMRLKQRFTRRAFRDPAEDTSPYQSKPFKAEDVNMWNRLEEIESVKSLEMTTLKQRQLQVGIAPRYVKDLKPLRVQLRSRMMKSCSTCSKVLVKPESRSNMIQFPVKFMAYDLLPRISIGSTTQTSITLNIINPCDVPVVLSVRLKDPELKMKIEPIEIELASKDDSSTMIIYNLSNASWTEIELVLTIIKGTNKVEVQSTLKFDL